MRLCVPEHHGGRRGRPRHLRGEQRRHGGERHRPRRVVPPPQNRLALVRRQDVETADRLLRLRCHRLQQLHQTASQRIDRGAVEQVVAIGESQLQRLARHRHEGQRIVGGIVAAHLAHLQAGRIGRRAAAVDRIVLEHHQRVEQIAQAGEALDLGKPEMLVRDQPRLALLQVRQQRQQRLGRRQPQPQRQRC